MTLARRKQIDPKEASVAATFFEPTYQRLRLWHQGQMLDLLCFTRETPAHVRNLMEEHGASPSKTFRADCFSEVWELPRAVLRQGALGVEAASFDRKLVEQLGCLAGQFSDQCGFLRWNDNSEQEDRRSHVASQLLRESNRRSTRTK